VIIKYVDWGIGSVTSDGVVRLNRSLQSEPKELQRVLAHELGHSRGAAYTWHDFFHDLKPDFVVWWFMLRHPCTWCGFLPVRRSEGVWVLDHGVVRILTIITLLTIFIGRLF